MNNKKTSPSAATFQEEASAVITAHSTCHANLLPREQAEVGCTKVSASKKLPGWLQASRITIGVVPLPVYLALAFVIFLFSASGKVASDLPTAIGVLTVGGFAFMALGQRIKILGTMGATAIMAFLVPSAMTFHGWIPAPIVKSVVDFTQASNFLYLYISVIVVGSILNMNREVLISGILKIFAPLTLASVVACVVGTATGVMMGMEPAHIIFMIIVPIMAGGIGEGAIPLAIGYALISGAAQTEIFAQIMPVVMIGGSTAVLLCGLINLLGKKLPHLTGEGRLEPNRDNNAPKSELASLGEIDLSGIAGAAVTIITLYLIGLVVQQYTSFPAPIIMLFCTVFLKFGKVFSPTLERNGTVIYKFFSSVVTWPLLFSMGVALTPWDKFVNGFSVATVVTTVATVASLIVTGFICARFTRTYPIDTAIVVACHSGQGSAGDIAILTAANRMELMPFAQISTRIGGATTVMLALIAYRYFS